jgi:hypothetical protein
LLGAVTRSEEDRAALIGRLYMRDDAAWLALLLTDLETDEALRLRPLTYGTAPYLNLTTGGRRIRMRHRVQCAFLTILGALTVLNAGVVPAQAAVTFRDMQTFHDVFTGDFQCQGELYNIDAQGRTIMHLTAAGFDDQGHVVFPLHFRSLDRGNVTAVPADGTGPTFRGHFSASDAENIRAVKHGEVIVEEDTDLFKSVAFGSDGSKISMFEHHHFTISANGDVTAVIDGFRASCR